jgi:hypothetical protein
MKTCQNCKDVIGEGDDHHHIKGDDYCTKQACTEAALAAMREDLAEKLGQPT